MKNRSHNHYPILMLVIFCSTLLGCVAPVEQAPRVEQNKLLKICTNLLMQTNETLSRHETKLPKQLKQRVHALLASAEISNQFEQYPICVNRLERARYFLSQTNITISNPTY